MPPATTGSVEFTTIAAASCWSTGSTLTSVTPPACTVSASKSVGVNEPSLVMMRQRERGIEPPWVGHDDLPRSIAGHEDLARFASWRVRPCAAASRCPPESNRSPRRSAPREPRGRTTRPRARPQRSGQARIRRARPTTCVCGSTLMPRLVSTAPPRLPQTDTSSVAGTKSTLLKYKVACVPAWLLKPANHASVVGPSHGATASCGTEPTVVRLNCTAPSDSVIGPLTPSSTGDCSVGPATAHVWPG